MSADRKFGRDLSIDKGQPFIPYKAFFGAFLPDPIMKTTILNGTEKVCWAKLNQYAGRDGVCYPSLNVLAKSIGVSVRQVNRIIKGLVDKGFITREAPDDVQKGQYQSTRYYFLWHECFNDALLKESLHISNFSLESDTKETTPHDTDDTTPNDIDDMTPHDLHVTTPHVINVITPNDAHVACPNVIHVTTPSDVDGTQRGSYIKDHIEEDHKEKGLKNIPDDKEKNPSPRKIFPNDSESQNITVKDSFETKKSALLEGYSPEQRVLIHECIDCLKLTRKSGKIANTVILAELERWQKIDPERVVHGIQVYMDKEYYLENKSERYLWGIIRNVQTQDIRGKTRGSPYQKQIELPFKNKKAFNTCKEWLQETTGGNHDEK